MGSYKVCIGYDIILIFHAAKQILRLLNSLPPSAMNFLIFLLFGASLSTASPHIRNLVTLGPQVDLQAQATPTGGWTIGPGRLIIPRTLNNNADLPLECTTNSRIASLISKIDNPSVLPNKVQVCKIANQTRTAQNHSQSLPSAQNFCRATRRTTSLLLCLVLPPSPRQSVLQPPPQLPTLSPILRHCSAPHRLPLRFAVSLGLSKLLSLKEVYCTIPIHMWKMVWRANRLVSGMKSARVL
jgi:hypothetical protein